MIDTFYQKQLNNTYKMIVISRPLLYSLAIHLIILAAFIFTLSHHSTKESRTSLKLQMISLSSSPAVFSKPTTSQAKTRAEPIPIQKSTPIAPATLPVNKTTPMVPTPPIVVKPTIPAMPVPTMAPVETPKAAHVPIPQAQSINVEKEFLDAHLGEIRALLIQNLKYPRNAQRLKMQGEVRVSFRLKSDGSVENIEIIKSSGFELLDEDAKALIKNTAPQFPKPTKSITLSVPLAYLLR